MTAKVRAFTLAFVVAVSVLAVGGAGVVGTAAAANAHGPVDLDTSDLAGEGTDSSPYEITNASELQAMEDDLGANYTLASDVDASETEDWNGGAGFSPIGDGADFTGTFTGNDYTVSNLSINRSSEDYVGLFGATDGGAIIENLGLEAVDIHGDSEVGGLVGENGGEVRESYVTGSVDGDGFDIGGLVGDNFGGEVRESYATADVYGGGYSIGGLVGNNGNGEVRESYATGDVDGGNFNVGGLVGDNDNGGGTTEGSYWDIETTGLDESEGGTGLTTARMTGANASAAGNMDGLDFEGTWYLTAAYPSLSPPFEGTGTEAEPYELETVLGLQGIRNDLSANYTLTRDVDASETSEWNGGDGFEPIARDTNPGESGYQGTSFTGTFDGDGHTISNLSINRGSTNYAGLFASIETGSSVVDIGLENVTVTANRQTGTLIGENKGTVERSFATGTLNASGVEIGGLVGINYGDILDTYASVNVTSTSRYVGGLVGANLDGTLARSYATGSLEADESYVGGLIGRYNTGPVTDSYWNIESTGQDVPNGLGVFDDDATGLTTAEMTGPNATVYMPGLDFDLTWRPGDHSYPDLAWNSEFDSTVDVMAGDGDATPHEITTVYELQLVRYNVGANYTLTNDIDASETEHWNSGAGFEPIGPDTSEGFTGHFDGDGHTILELSINRGSETSVGLFGAVNDGTIESVNLENVSVVGSEWVGGLVGYNLDGEMHESSATGTVDGAEHIGGLVGTNNNGKVSASSAAATVDGFKYIGGLVGEHRSGIITESSATGSVVGSEDVGGLVGSHSGSVSTSSATGSVDGGNRVGGLVGVSLGEVTESYATGTVDGGDRVGGLIGASAGEVTESYATGTVDGSNQYVGGLVGANAGEVTASYATGTVAGSVDVGGLVGVNSNDGGNSLGVVNESYATGSVLGSENVGGFVGNNDGTLSNSSASGTVNGSANVGGFVGVNAEEIRTSFATGYVNSTGTDIGGLVGNSSGTVLDVYWDVNTTGQTDSAGGATGLTTTQMAAANASADGNMDGLDFESTWYLTAAYPSLTAPFDGEGTGAQPYELETVLHLQEMRKSLSASYRLTNDIDASETEHWNNGAGFDPVGYTDFGAENEFTGTFDGNDHRISDLYIDRDEDYVGLFGSTSDAEIQRVGLENVDVTGNENVGGLVGSNTDSDVTDTYVNGTIRGRDTVGGLFGRHLRGNVTDSYATGTVGGEDDVGGFVGRANINANIIDSHATVEVNGERRVGGFVGYLASSSRVIDSHAAGSVKGTDTVGGLVGNNEDISYDEGYGIVNSYATGTVDGTTHVGGLVGNNENSDVITSYATGEVNGTNNVGGLVGDNSGTVVDAYWDTETTNQSTSAGDDATGLTTDEMTGLNATENMEGLDFDETWTELDGYPIHQYAVSELSVDLADDEIGEGETTEATVAVTAYGQHGYWANTTADYDSSDTRVASVDRGTVTAERGGSTVIEAARAGVNDEVSLSVRRVSTGGGGSGGSDGSGGSGGDSADPTADDDDTEPGELQMNDDGSVSMTTSASADVPVSIDFGDSVRDDESETRFGRVDLTFGEDTEVSFTARLTSRDDLPDGTPALGGDGNGDGGTGETSGSDRAISYVEFTVASDGVDASDRISSSTIEFDTSSERLEEGGVAVEDVALHRYDGEAGEWTELDTEIVEESDIEITYEATTPGFSYFAVGKRIQTGSEGDETTPSRPTTTPPTTPTDTPTDSRVTTQETETTAADGPGFGIITALVSLLSVALFRRRRT